MISSTVTFWAEKGRGKIEVTVAFARIDARAFPHWTPLPAGIYARQRSLQGDYED